MHRNGFGFRGHRTGSLNVVPVSSTFNCDGFASPSLSRARQTTRQTDRCGGLSELDLAQCKAQSSLCLFALPSLHCLSAGYYQREGPVIIQENPSLALESNLLYSPCRFKRND